MNRGTKIICLRRKVLAAVGCAVAAFLMCWVVSSPKVVGAAATERQLPIYCVQKEYTVLSISFDETWGMAECSGFQFQRFGRVDRKDPVSFQTSLLGFCMAARGA